MHTIATDLLIVVVGVALSRGGHINDPRINDIVDLLLEIVDNLFIQLVVLDAVFLLVLREKVAKRSGNGVQMI